MEHSSNMEIPSAGSILGTLVALSGACSPQANRSDLLGTSREALAPGPMLGPETAVDHPVFDNKPNTSDPAVASNRASYLLAWSEPLLTPGSPSWAREAFGI